MYSHHASLVGKGEKLSLFAPHTHADTHSHPKLWNTCRTPGTKISAPKLLQTIP